MIKIENINEEQGSYLGQDETPSSMSLDCDGFFSILTPNTSKDGMEVSFGMRIRNKMERMRGMKMMSDKRCTKGFIALPNCCLVFFSTKVPYRENFHFMD